MHSFENDYNNYKNLSIQKEEISKGRDFKKGRNFKRMFCLGHSVATVNTTVKRAI